MTTEKLALPWRIKRGGGYFARMRRARPVTLTWNGKGHGLAAEEATHPQRAWATSDRLGWLVQGDNLACMRGLATHRAGSVMLAYLDPPFFTNREHSAWVVAIDTQDDMPTAGNDQSRRKRSRTQVHAFDDRWPDLAAWLEALGARLVVIRELLSSRGSMDVHVDSRTSHYVRILGDEIFGMEAFTSEIVWRYRRWPSKTPNFQRVHDVLLRWRKDVQAPPRFNQLHEPLAASTLATWGTKKQRAVFADDGRRTRSSSTAEPTAGVPMGDVWDIGVIAPVARERTGYPSQKPEALIDRLTRALSDPGDLILDPYAGSGTTLVVARRLERGFVGIDCGAVAIETICSRFAALPSKGGSKGGSKDALAEVDVEMAFRTA